MVGLCTGKVHVERGKRKGKGKRKGGREREIEGGGDQPLSFSCCNTFSTALFSFRDFRPCVLDALCVSSVLSVSVIVILTVSVSVCDGVECFLWISTRFCYNKARGHTHKACLPPS